MLVENIKHTQTKAERKQERETKTHKQIIHRIINEALCFVSGMII